MKKEHINNIYLASGNGKVILNKDNSLGNDQYAGIFFTKRGGTLDLNGHNQTFTRIAATDDGTTITNSDTTKEAVLAINNEDSYIYHGNINGNIKLTHNINSQDKKTNAKLILDGSVNTKNDVEVSNASLTMQGHARPCNRACNIQKLSESLLPGISLWNGLGHRFERNREFI